MTSLLVLFLSAALAGSPGGHWETKPYIQPRVNIRAVSVNGNLTAQAVLGAEGGLQYNKLGSPWQGRTRLSAIGMYGLTSGSLGADVRLGSFIGPKFGIFRYEVGPDFWYNGYGKTNATDYHLPWSPGVSIPNTVILSFHEMFGVLGSATPGWAFLPERAGGGIGPFHEFTLLGALMLRLGGAGITVGYQSTWDSAGVTKGVVFSGSL
ncbi:MAG: hypothetical protein HN348_10135 [Proteobacteria bacterium]|nr:hypothetical protein [Pseudomonadota bacterium]